MVETRQLRLSTKGQVNVIDITNGVKDEVSESSISSGIVTVFVPGSTGGITTIEYEPGLIKDVKEFYDKLIPYGKDYAHHNTWGDDNGSSHLQSMLQKTSLTVPFNDKRLLLGQWQQIVFIDFDTRPRNRTLILQIVGD